MQEKVKVGLFGLGHLGRIHLKCILESEKLELVGAFDPDPKAHEIASETYDYQQFSSEEELMNAVEIVDIVVPTIFHYTLAHKALEMGKHIFIEKPLAQTVEEAEQLLKLSKEKNCKTQVGHVERFNPAYLALKEMNFKPVFIEGHRLAFFNPRGTDVSVVYDLMIHDLDMVLSLVDSDIEKVEANGVSIVSKQADICNARIQFKNGCVANLTASRISLKNMRKLRLFQEDAYISMDFLEKTSEIIQLKDGDGLSEKEKETMFHLELPDGDKYIRVNTPEIAPVNAIKMELESLARSIHQNEKTIVTMEDGYKALQLAAMISDEMKRSATRYVNF